MKGKVRQQIQKYVGSYSLGDSVIEEMGQIFTAIAPMKSAELKDHATCGWGINQLKS
ncbi:hypothetical protein GTQ43_14635 [Nostoc sp. KVJ3]|uniref:hypothetical protein n=1 Tax=Nostoc sp. KVJ3 TaxID=457945 RepID=UPI002236FB06|nr:hypothetical protein [Nostoc sp. KVJ3]MCW5315000.1 hypothetical protein [Nostoc sp. KVJ3]